MTKEWYKIKLGEIESNYENAKKALWKEYAKANNPYKSGDIITDHHTTIKIESISFYKGVDMPQCIYKGIQLNKDGSISKRQDKNVIYQQNIRTTN